MVVVANAGVGGVGGGLSVGDLVVQGRPQCTRRLLCAALTGTGEDLRQSAVDLRLLADLRAVSQSCLGLDSLPFLGFEGLLCRACRLLRGGLLGVQMCTPLAVRSAEDGHLTVVELRG